MMTIEGHIDVMFKVARDTNSLESLVDLLSMKSKTCQPEDEFTCYAPRDERAYRNGYFGFVVMRDGRRLINGGIVLHDLGDGTYSWQSHT